MPWRCFILPQLSVSTLLDRLVEQLPLNIVAPCAYLSVSTLLDRLVEHESRKTIRFSLTFQYPLCWIDWLNCRAYPQPRYIVDFQYPLCWIDWLNEQPHTPTGDMGLFQYPLCWIDWLNRSRMDSQISSRFLSVSTLLDRLVERRPIRC